MLDSFEPKDNLLEKIYYRDYDEIMPYRKTVFAENQFYHILNRGVAGSPIFLTLKDYSRFLELIDYYRHIYSTLSFSSLKKLPNEEKEKVWRKLENDMALHIEIIAFCLMKNHFHILLKQTGENGITTFMKNLQNSYAKYFNIKNSRMGPLFQSMFKAVMIETDEQLLHVSRYIHLNPSTGYLVGIKDLPKYPWSSLPIYLGEIPSTSKFINSVIVLESFKTREEYRRFVFDRAEYQRELDKIKHFTLE